MGKNVQLDTIEGKIKGKAVKIDNDGALIVSHNTKLVRVFAGDVIHLSK
ncbi:MAG: hypothetical protein OER82_09660 [Nitrosopumilus sp.]|nr:hypothetical protein [Nitrosopumilus sp.]